MKRGPESASTVERVEPKEAAINIGRRALMLEKIYIAFSGGPGSEHLQNQLVIPVLADTRATELRIIH